MLRCSVAILLDAECKKHVTRFWMYPDFARNSNHSSQRFTLTTRRTSSQYLSIDTPLIAPTKAMSKATYYLRCTRKLSLQAGPWQLIFWTTPLPRPHLRNSRHMIAESNTRSTVSERTSMEALPTSCGPSRRASLRTLNMTLIKEEICP